jgi:hypothetical protein
MLPGIAYTRRQERGFKVPAPYSRTQISEALLKTYRFTRRGVSGVYTVDARSDEEARDCAISFFGALIFDDRWVKVVHVRSSRQVQIEDGAVPTDEEVGGLLASRD